MAAGDRKRISRIPGTLPSACSAARRTGHSSTRPPRLTSPSVQSTLIERPQVTGSATSTARA